jgi:hypothetical protein
MRHPRSGPPVSIPSSLPGLKGSLGAVEAACPDVTLVAVEFCVEGCVVLADGEYVGEVVLPVRATSLIPKPSLRIDAIEALV